MRTGRARDRLPAKLDGSQEKQKGHISSLVQTLLCASGFITTENEKSREGFSNICCTVTFYYSLGLGQSSQMQDSGVWMNPDCDRNWLWISYWKKNKVKSLWKVFLINMHLYGNSSLSLVSSKENRPICLLMKDWVLLAHAEGLSVPTRRWPMRGLGALWLISAWLRQKLRAEDLCPREHAHFTVLPVIPVPDYIHDCPHSIPPESLGRPDQASGLRADSTHPGACPRWTLHESSQRVAARGSLRDFLSSDTFKLR